jgi:hypothetical protein
MHYQSVDTWASIFTAFGTVAVAILAIWGDQVKDYFLGPRLTLSLVSESGDLTKRVNGTKVYYYHLRVTNGKRRLPARGVRVVVQGISKRAPSGAFVRQPLVYPLQLVWTPMEPGEVERTIVQNSTCDFGFLDETGNEQAFRPAVLLLPNNFRGYVKTDQCVRFEVVATGLELRIHGARPSSRRPQVECWQTRIVPSHPSWLLEFGPPRIALRRFLESPHPSDLPLHP